MKITKRPIIRIVLLAVFILSSGAFIYSKFQADKAADFNVILLTLDALRPDHLGCYGYSKNTSPNIDKLAREGVMFTQAIAQSSWTRGSVPSFMTSTYESTNNIYRFGDVLDKKFVTLSEILRSQGYETLASSGGDWIMKDFPGIARGFNYFVKGAKPDEIAQEIIAWIKEKRNKKFFIWVHFLEYPHIPYDPLSPFSQLFLSNEKSKEIPIAKDGEFFGVIPKRAAINKITNVNYYISQYDSEIAFADAGIGEMLDYLKKSGLDRKTIIVLSSDHGESLGEHNYYFQHGYYLFDQLLKVPLIIKGPGLPENKTIHAQVQLVDIMPTILSMLKVKTTIRMEGVDLLPVVFDNIKNTGYAFSEVFNIEDFKCVRTTDWKLILNAGTGKYELYNLKNDPQELYNLIEVKKEEFGLLKAKLEGWINRPKLEAKQVSGPLDAETKVKLKSLGYLQ